MSIKKQSGASQLKEALNTLDPSGNWRGGGVDGDADFSHLMNGDPWIAMVADSPTNRHWVIVDGFDNAGNVKILDPWGMTPLRFNHTGEGTSYSMTEADFKNIWFEQAIFKR